jgi:DNA-binding beta-propeller fold protein YncE
MAMIHIRHMLSAAGIALCLTVGSFAQAQLVISVNDGKVALVDGKLATVEGRDSLTLIDFSGAEPRVTARIDVPTSVVGPPSAVDVTPDGKLALVTSGFRRNPSDPMAATVADDSVSVVDLASASPKLVDTVHAGLGAAGISINREGTLALVANRSEGTVSVLRIQNGKVTPHDKLVLGDAKSGPSQVVFSPDGKRAFVTRDGDGRITMLAVDGTKVSVTSRDMFPGQRPYGLAMGSRGDVAVVANIGQGQGDADTISLIDLQAQPPRVVDTVSVGQTPEGLGMSADGRLVGVNVMNGSNKPKNSPFRAEHGSFVLLRVEKLRLVRLSETPIGAYTQGLAFVDNDKRVLIQNGHEREIQVLGIEGDKVSDTGIRVSLDALPSSLRVVRDRK